MPALAKATLQEISATEPAEPVNGAPAVEVQFNPQTLKLALASRVEGGDSKGKQVRQWIGKTSTTLSFDLHFDTADEGTTDKPVSVRTKTAMVEKYVLPKENPTEKQATPKVRFHWSELIFDGLIESLNIDFDLFAADGTPLRAKMAVTIKEQDAKYELGKSGPAANTPGNASPPGQGGAGPGSIGFGASFDLSATALDGESAADFLARNGLDPAAWRGVAGQLGSALSLEGGLEVGFNAGLSVNAGVGVAVGVEVGGAASLEGAFGLQTDGGAAISAGVALGGASSAGFALAAAGGVSAAIEAVAAVRSDSAAAEARRAFESTPVAASSSPATSAARAAAAPGVGLPSPIAVTAGAALASKTSPSPSAPEQARPPLRTQGLPTLAAQAAAPAAPPPPRADARATSFGFGVPLRPRVGGAAELRSSALASRIPLRPRGAVTAVLEPDDPTEPAWKHLPRDAARVKADAEQMKRYPARACGCRSGCHRCGGGR